ncbi:MAG: DUF4129 domain-containing protein [Saprospiraceae bacterium]|nr:DUF4129 domain-containing protein [Saprospiraceae bacterium]MDZ4706081.1 DUF4129 domain-containing protein [Saprospiraceae bacterium]
MLKLRFIQSGHLVYCVAIIALSVLLPMPSALGQVGAVVDEPPYEEIEEAIEEGVEDGEEPAQYSWLNEYQYYEEVVEKRDIDEANWKKAIEGLDYNKTIKPKKKKETSTKPADAPELPDLSGSGNFFQWLFRGLLLLAGIAIIVLIVMSIIQMNPAPKDVIIRGQTVEGIDLQHIEENLNTADLDPLIQRAIAQENHTMAVRLYYLAILKKLSQQQLVVWKRDKTNRDYFRELKGSSLQRPFQAVTRDFEWVWYGDGAIGKQDFQRMQGQFQQMLSLIPQNNKP